MSRQGCTTSKKAEGWLDETLSDRAVGWLEEVFRIFRHAYPGATDVEAFMHFARSQVSEAAEIGFKACVEPVLRNPGGERLYFHATKLGDSGAEPEDCEFDFREPCERDEANIIGSLCADGQHRPALDIDHPCRLVPSSTRGHFHLYVDVPMSSEQYVELVQAFEKAGIVTPFYAKAAQIRGGTFCRPPWVKKPKFPDKGQVFDDK